MQAPTSGPTWYGSNLGNAIVVPKADGDNSGVLEFPRKGLLPTPNKRHSAGRIGDVSGGGAKSALDPIATRIAPALSADGGEDDADGSVTDDDSQKLGPPRDQVSWPDATPPALMGSEEREEGTRTTTTSWPWG